MHWSKVSILTPILLILALSVNETLLYAAKHQPSIVDDADLFCNNYSKIKDLGHDDVVFLGASQMQTGIDLATLHDRYPRRKALLLAQSGLGSSFRVFKDIVEKTNYNGIAILDESESTLLSQGDAQSVSVNHCHNNFSINRQLNRNISTWLQNHVMFLNPQSSSLRLWGNLASQRKLPVPFYTKTLGDRQQFTNYANAQPQALQLLHDSRVKGIEKESATLPSPPFSTWFLQTQHWQQPIEKFQQRGGRVIFVRMPVDVDRWQFERKLYPPDRYWHPWMKKLNVNSVHFAEDPDLSAFQLPDTSHLDMHDKPKFTKRLLDRLSSSF